jgi:hypothetical protein
MHAGEDCEIWEYQKPVQTKISNRDFFRQIHGFQSTLLNASDFKALFSCGLTLPILPVEQPQFKPSQINFFCKLIFSSYWFARLVSHDE